MFRSSALFRGAVALLGLGLAFSSAVADSEQRFLLFSSVGGKDHDYNHKVPVVSGSVALTVGVVDHYGDDPRAQDPSLATLRLQLLVDERPVNILSEPGPFPRSLVWDSRTLTDGVHALSLKVLEGPTTLADEFFTNPALVVVDNVAGPVSGSQSVAICPDGEPFHASVSQDQPLQTDRCDFINYPGAVPTLFSFPAPVRKGVPFSTLPSNPDHDLYVQNIVPTLTLYTTVQRFFKNGSGHVMPLAMDSHEGDFYEPAAKSLDNFPLTDGPRNAAFISAYLTGTVHPDTEELIFAESAFDRARVGRISLDGTVTTIAGWRTKSSVLPYPAHDDTVSSSTRNDQYELVGDFRDGPQGLKLAMDVAVDPRDHNIIFVADAGNHRIVRIDTSVTPAVVTTYAGSLAGISGYQEGNGTSALFHEPFSLAMNGAGVLYVADRDNCVIRRVDPGANHAVTTVVGQAHRSEVIANVSALNAKEHDDVLRARTYRVDGPFASASIVFPMSLRMDSHGDLILAEERIATLRKINLTSGTVDPIRDAPTESPWVWIDVDKEATFGPRDDIFFVAATGGSGNTEADRVSANGQSVQGLFQGSYNIDARLGHIIPPHYPWLMAVGKGALWINGFGSPGAVRVTHAQPSDPDDDTNVLYDVFKQGQDVFIRGTVSGFPRHARPSFRLLHGAYGWSELGFPNFDNLATLTDAQLGDLIRGGFHGGTPRPEITGRDMRDLIYFIRRSSLPGLKATPGPAPSDGTAPTISSATVAPVGPDGARITWTTNEPTIGFVYLGPAAGVYWRWSDIEGGFSTNHSIIFDKLIAGRTYHYSIVAKDDAGNQRATADGTFIATGGGPDTQPPDVSMTAPANNAAVSGSTTVAATATDNVGVVGVQFQLDGSNLGSEDTAAPYSITWDTTLTSNGSHVLRAIARDAAGNQATSVSVTVTVTNRLRSKHDFDGDLKTDIAIFRPGEGSWFIRKSSSGATLLIPNWGMGSSDVPVPGDYDGDGKADVAVFRPISGEWFIRQSSNGALLYIPNWGMGSTDVPVAADYDGDGKTDAAIFRPLSGEWFVRRSSNGSMFYVPNYGVASGDKPVPADYDGDGKADIAIFRPLLGNWYIRRSTDGGTTFIPNWGPQAIDHPVPCDYDGDGRSDVAVFRSGEGNWYVRRSSDGQMLLIGSWGMGANDIPVAGDYDGDGKCDAAVFRPIEGGWYIKGSAGTPIFVMNFGPRTGDKPVPAF